MVLRPLVSRRILTLGTLMRGGGHIFLNGEGGVIFIQLDTKFRLLFIGNRVITMTVLVQTIRHTRQLRPPANTIHIIFITNLSGAIQFKTTHSVFVRAIQMKKYMLEIEIWPVITTLQANRVQTTTREEILVAIFSHVQTWIHQHDSSLVVSDN